MIFAVANRGFVVPKELKGTCSFLFYNLEEGRALDEREEILSAYGIEELIGLLHRCKAQTLICGAVDPADRQLLESAGIRVIYGIANGVLVAVSRFESGELVSREPVAAAAPVQNRAYCSGNCSACPNPCH